MPIFHFVSGLKGLEAILDADKLAFEEAGIVELKRRIHELANPEGRLRSVSDELIQISDDLSYWLAEYRDERDRPLKTWWRPDSWARWAAADSSIPLKLRIERQLDQAGQVQR